MKTLYIANDGTEFDTEQECIDYEEELDAFNQGLSEVVCLDDNFEKFVLSGNDCCDCWQSAYFVYVPTMNAMRALCRHIGEQGYSDSQYLTSPGYYYYDEKDDQWVSFAEARKYLNKIADAFGVEIADLCCGN